MIFCLKNLRFINKKNKNAITCFSRLILLTFANVNFTLIIVLAISVHNDRLKHRLKIE